MLLDRVRWYSFMLSLCVVGYTWAGLNYFNVISWGSFCLFKRITHISCPSCGSTRFIEALLKGDWKHCLHFNPLGIVILAFLVIIPTWCVYDLIGNKNSFRLFYQRSELFFQQKKIYLPCIIALLVNWGWNIYKGL